MEILHHKGPSGFTMLEVLAMIFIGAVMAIVLLPYLARPRGCTARANCVNNQKQIGVTFRIWALDHGDQYPMNVSTNNGGTLELVKSGNAFPHFLAMSNELETPVVLFCPREKEPGRSRANTFTSSTGFGLKDQVVFRSDTNLTYFVGVDASDVHPKRFLIGDDNFTIDDVRMDHRLVGLWTNRPVAWTTKRHGGTGNVGLADGSVRQFTTVQFQKAIADAGMRATRLAMP